MSVENVAHFCSSNGHAISYQPHAVVVPWPGQGHITPLLHLSRRLVSEYGFVITFVNLDFTHRLLTSSLEREDDACNIKFVSLPDGLPAEATRSTGNNVMELCKAVLHSSPAFERLLAELRPPPVCVVSDIFAPHTQDAANKLGIPRVAFWTQSAACFAAHVAAARGLLPLGCGEEKLVDIIPGVPPLRFKDLPGFLQTNNLADFMFDCSTQPFTRLEEASCVLMNTVEAMEADAMEALRQQMPGCRFYTIGPVLPLEYFSGMTLSKSTLNTVPGLWAEDYSCLQWLDTQQAASVLYVSLGSKAELSKQELQEFALGLEATCLPVLWVLRPGLVGGGEHASLPPNFKARTQGRMLIISWAPQLHVLAHPSVGAFFTHAGWNSTLEAVSQGKPLLGFPFCADQMLNCRCIEDLWHNGIALERHGQGLLTRSIVESKVCELMSDKKLHNAALSIRDSVRRAVKSEGHGSSTSNLHHLVEALEHKS